MCVIQNVIIDKHFLSLLTPKLKVVYHVNTLKLLMIKRFILK